MSKQKSTNLNAFVSKFGFSLLLIFTISFHSKGQDIVIETQNSALVFRVSSAKTLQQIYLGEALSNIGDYQQLPNTEIDTWITGGMNTIREPALLIKQADGSIRKLSFSSIAIECRKVLFETLLRRLDQ